MAWLGIAQCAFKLLPFRYWRATLGRLGTDTAHPAHAGADAHDRTRARQIAVHVERGAQRLPFATKCLPRAMALCWLLRTADQSYVFKIAVRPADARQTAKVENKNAR